MNVIIYHSSTKLQQKNSSVRINQKPLQKLSLLTETLASELKNRAETRSFLLVHVNLKLDKMKDSVGS